MTHSSACDSIHLHQNRQRNIVNAQKPAREDEEWNLADGHSSSPLTGREGRDL